MKRINLILAVSCLFLFSCEVDSIQTQEEADANLIIEQNKQQEGSGSGVLYGSDNPTATCPPLDADFEHRLTWTAYIAGLAIFEEPNIINELRAELSLNSTTKALSLSELLGSNSNAPLFKQEFERLASDIMNEVATTQIVVCPDTPAGGPDDPTGGDICGGCDPYQLYMNEILVQNCIELYFPRGIYTDLTVDITTVAHPLCYAWGNDGYTRTNCGSVVETFYIYPNTVQTKERTYIVARPVKDLSNSNCTYSQYTGLDLLFYLNGSWPLAN